MKKLMKKLMYTFLSQHAAVLLCVCLTTLALLGLVGPRQAAAATATTTPPSKPTPSFTPVGVTWTLTVSFLNGSRQGQSEISVMTFQPDGSLTATFPGSGLLPAINGEWQMTGRDTFHYSFIEHLVQNGQMVASLRVAIDAYLTSAQTYVAGGVGVAYSATTHQPLPGLYNVTKTTATAS